MNFGSILERCSRQTTVSRTMSKVAQLKTESISISTTLFLLMAVQSFKAKAKTLSRLLCNIHACVVRQIIRFGDVRIRVDPNFTLAMHIDTDEANAANLRTGAHGFLDGIQNE